MQHIALEFTNVGPVHGGRRHPSSSATGEPSSVAPGECHRSVRDGPKVCSDHSVRLRVAVRHPKSFVGARMGCPRKRGETERYTVPVVPVEGFYSIRDGPEACSDHSVRLRVAI